MVTELVVVRRVERLVAGLDDRHAGLGMEVAKLAGQLWEGGRFSENRSTSEVWVRRTQTNGSSSNEHDVLRLAELVLPCLGPGQEIRSRGREVKRTFPHTASGDDQHVPVDLLSVGEVDPATLTAVFLLHVVYLAVDDPAESPDAITGTEYIVVRQNGVMFEIGFGGDEHTERGREVEKVVATSEQGHGVCSGVELFVKCLSDGNTSGSTANNDDAELGCHEE